MLKTGENYAIAFKNCNFGQSTCKKHNYFSHFIFQHIQEFHLLGCFASLFIYLHVQMHIHLLPCFAAIFNYLHVQIIYFITLLNLQQFYPSV